MAGSLESREVQVSETSLSNQTDIPQAASLLKKLEQKLCPEFMSSHDFDGFKMGILQLLLNCTHLQDSKQSEFCLARQINYTILDLIDVAQSSKCISYYNWKYSCTSAGKLNPKLIMIGVLRPNEDGSIHLEDQTGFINCVFTCGSTSSIDCPVDHKIGRGWSIHCVVAIADFYVVLEKKIDANEKVYLIVNEDDVIPLTDAITKNDVTNFTTFDSAVSYNFLDSFSRLSLGNENIISSRNVFKSPSDIPYSSCTRSTESSHSFTTVGQQLNSSADSEKHLFICKLIIPIQKTLPAKKNGRIGFRMEVLIVSNVVVENSEKEVFDGNGKDNRMVSRQALDFYDYMISSYSKFQMDVVYAYKRPLCINMQEDLKILLMKEISCSVITVTEKCQFIPFIKSSEFCPVHGFEDKILPLHSSKYQRVAGLPCLCSVSDMSICVSDISVPTTCCYVNITVKGIVKCKVYRDGEKNLCGSRSDSMDTIVLTLSDCSSKINLYLKPKYFQSCNYLLGLLPGMEVLLSGLQCHDSRNGNRYLKPSNDMSVRFLQYSPQPHLIVSNEVPVLPEEKEMPLYFFAKINRKMKCFRSISFILKITSLSILPSGDVASFYLESCPPKLKACFLADDGSDQRYIICRNDTVGQLLSITMAELEALKYLAESVEGGLHFKASRWQQNPVESLSPEMQFLSKLCQRPDVQRQMVLRCKAFETDPKYSNEDVFGSTMILCISMSDTKAVKLSTELFRHINRELC